MGMKSKVRGQRSAVHPSCKTNDQEQCIKKHANVAGRLLGFSLPEVQTADFLCAITSNTSINPFDKHSSSPKVTTFYHSSTASNHTSYFSASHPNQPKQKLKLKGNKKTGITKLW